MKTRAAVACALMVVICAAAAIANAQAAVDDPGRRAVSFAPLEQWKTSILLHDKNALEKMFSTDPAATVQGGDGDSSVKDEVDFWMERAKGVQGVNLEVVAFDDNSPDTRQVAFQAELVHPAEKGTRSEYVLEGQLWSRQNAEWKIIRVKRGKATRLQQPMTKGADLYPGDVDAHREIEEALVQAKAGHKRVLVVFGADWCYDCHVLDKAFHRADIAPTLEANFEIVHVNIGQGDKNQDVMQKYQVPMERGIPAIAVLDATGSLLYSQKAGEFESARSLAPDDILDFLNKWKPPGNSLRGPC